MRQVPEDVLSALQRWHRAYTGYEKAEGDPLAAAELVQASAALSAAFEDCGVPCDQSLDVARWAAEGGRGAT